MYFFICLQKYVNSEVVREIKYQNFVMKLNTWEKHSKRSAKVSKYMRIVLKEI